MSLGTEFFEESALYQFLGIEGINELRSKLIDMIVEEVHSQFRESSSYIISPEEIGYDLYQSVIDGLVDEIKAEYKERVAEAVKKKLDGIL